MNKKYMLPILSALLALGMTFMLPIPSASAAASWPNVEQGNIGENVYSLQYMLRARGYSISADGDFGPLTASAVESFQTANNLGVDGEVGPQTWPMLIVSSSQGDQGDQVLALQRQLNAHGANLTLDGNDGANTTAAVKSFQSSQGLTADGQASVTTWQALVGTSSATLAKIVSYAQAIQNGDAEPGWSGGDIPYSWAGGHGSKPGPTLGSCDGYTGSIHPCPADTTIGLDCSGFARWVYALSYGDDVLGSGNTDSELAHMHKVSSSAAQPGDLAFFGNSTTDTEHVGIYIGNGEMINAYETGTYVQTNNVSDVSDFLGYYAY